MSMASEHAARRARLGCPSTPSRPTIQLALVTPAPEQPPEPDEIARQVERIVANYREVCGYDAPVSSYKSRLALIIDETAEKYEVSKADILSHVRDPKLVIPRHEIMWRARKETEMSYPQIGRKLGERDHTTVMHGVKRHQERLDREAAQAVMVNPDAYVERLVKTESDYAQVSSATGIL